MQCLLDDLKIFYEKVAAVCDVLQLHFHETHWILGRPLITDKSLEKYDVYTFVLSKVIFPESGSSKSSTRIPSYRLHP